MSGPRAVWIDGVRVALAPAQLVGQGGEAEVYDLGDGRVLKWWKPASHPDFAGLPAEQAAAVRRLAERPAKLRDLPAGLPAQVIVPTGLARAGKASAQVVGFVMPKVTGTPLHAYGEPRWRRDHPVPGDDVVAALLALHDAIAGLHARGVVIGDCNDLNVLVDGRRVHLIDVDSYQFGAHACPMFSERFVDPRLCDPPTLAPVRPHDPASDWFAFAVMVVRSLLGVGPWGGVHQPADPAARCPPGQRALRRLSVLAGGVIYPRAARPVATLPPALVDVFRGIFERDDRGVFPRAALAQLTLRACRACGDEHARAACPTCQTAVVVPPVAIHGRLRWTAVPRASVALPSYAVGRTTPVFLDGGALWRAGRLGPERIGGVLAASMRAWVGARLGVGFYRAGGFAAGFVFQPDRGVLDDRVALPPVRGELVSAHATVGEDRAWLWLVTAPAGRLVTTCVVVGADARVLAATPVPDAPWLAGVAGACAAGPHLFVPTDDGVARVELGAAGHLVLTRTFPETAPLVTAGDRLALAPGGLVVLRARDALHLQLT